MKWVLRLLAALTPLVLLVQNTLRGWTLHPLFWETWRYLVNEALLAWFAAALFALAFLAHKKARKITARLCLSVSITLSCFVLFDAYVLLLNSETTGPGGALCLTHQNWMRKVEFNSYGFWDDECQQLPRRNRSYAPPVVVAVGDSFTFGQGLSERSQRFTNLIEQALPRIELVNASQGGTNTQEQINHLLPKVAALEPDYVIYFYLPNDIQDTVGFPQPKPREFSREEKRALAASPAWNYFYWKMVAAYQFEDDAQTAFSSLRACYQHAENFQLHVKDLQLYMEQIKGMGAQPMAVILPFPHLWEGASDQERDEILDKVETALISTGAKVLRLDDLEKTFPVGEFEVNSMDSHPNEKVHAAIAERVAAWLEESL